MDNRDDYLESPLLISDIFWALTPNVDNLYRKFLNLLCRQLAGKFASAIEEKDVLLAGYPEVLAVNNLQGRLGDLSNGLVVDVVCRIVEFVIKFEMLIDEDSK